MRFLFAIVFCSQVCLVGLEAQTNPLWHEQKVKNYLPHMTWPEVQDLLTRTDIVIIPIASMEQHGPQGPIGTDFLSANERAKLIAQKTDVLVVRCCCRESRHIIWNSPAPSRCRT